MMILFTFCSSYGLLTSCPSICRGKLYVLTTICMDFASMVRLANLTTPWPDILLIITVWACPLYLYLTHLSYLIKETLPQFIHLKPLPLNRQNFLIGSRKLSLEAPSLRIQIQKLLKVHQNRLVLCCIPRQIHLNLHKINLIEVTSFLFFFTFYFVAKYLLRKFLWLVPHAPLSPVVLRSG